MSDDRLHRVVVGSTGGEESARRRARALLMSGREVVYVGGGQGVQQLALTAQAEDAGEIVVDASAAERADLASAVQELGLGRIRITAV